MPTPARKAMETPVEPGTRLRRRPGPALDVETRSPSGDAPRGEGPRPGPAS